MDPQADPDYAPRPIVVHKSDVQVVARHRELRVWASPRTEYASPFDAEWHVEIEGLGIEWGDLGLDAALAGLAQRVRAELPELLDGKNPPPEDQLSLLFQLRIADRQGRLEYFLQSATQTSGWEYDQYADPGLRYDPNASRFVDDSARE